jgi:hypothetical protein
MRKSRREPSEGLPHNVSLAKLNENGLTCVPAAP